MKVLILAPYPLGEAASQRFRFEQYLPLLHKNKIDYKFAPFWSRTAWEILYRKGYTLQKVVGLLRGFWGRFKLLFELPGYDFIFIHREATPVGPPWFEWLAAKVFQKKLIYDFDDAIWQSNTSPENNLAAKHKQHSKVGQICRWSYRVSCGNRYLQAYAAQFSTGTVVLLPTTIDTANLHNRIKQHKQEKVTIGWTGSHSTLPYLKELESVLQALEEKYVFDFLVIADKEPALEIQSLRFVPWSKAKEIDELLRIDIGVMPLPDTEWAKGKCAFKALQYMALGIPAVVSAVGANTEAVVHGKTGYVCQSPQEWYQYLEALLLSHDLRSNLGTAGRQWVEEKYATQAHAETFLNLFT